MGSSVEEFLLSCVVFIPISAEQQAKLISLLRNKEANQRRCEWMHKFREAQDEKR